MAYADRKNVMSQKDLRALSKWAGARPKEAEANQVSEQRRALWIALNAFIGERGGAIVSPMFVSPVRIEVPPDSELPAKLTEAGYDLTFREQATRIGAPIAEPVLWGQRSRRNDAYSFRTVDVFELRLPK
jgi:hypothetical protein